MSKSDRPVVVSAEDDPDDQILIKEAVEVTRHLLDLHFVENGHKLMHYLCRPEGRRLPDLILLDLNMPSMDGRDALRKIKATDRLKNIPVVVFTTSNAEEDQHICSSLGVNDYVTKPGSFESLTKTLKRIFDKWL